MPCLDGIIKREEQGIEEQKIVKAQVGRLLLYKVTQYLDSIFRVLMKYHQAVGKETPIIHYVLACQSMFTSGTIL